MVKKRALQGIFDVYLAVFSICIYSPHMQTRFAGNTAFSTSRHPVTAKEKRPRLLHQGRVPG